MLLTLSVIGGGWSAQWRCRHVLLGSVSSVRGIGGVLHKHGMVALGSVRMCDWRRGAVKDMGLGVILGLCIDYAGVEVRVLWVVGV